VAFDYDVVIVGSGPAGLAASLHLSRAGYRALVLERELFGGNLQHTALIDDYPGFPKGIPGAQLAGLMLDHASASGVAIQQGEVSGVELFSRSRWVACSDGRGFSCGAVILACGTHYSRLGIPNEDKFRGRGVVDCTPCDGGFFVGRDVVVYGSTDHAVRDARYLCELGVRVTLLAPDGGPRPGGLEGVTIREGARLMQILGSDRVEGVVYSAATGAEEHLAAQGVLVRVGSEPATGFLADVVDLDTDGYVLTNAHFETSSKFVLACGNARAGARPRIASAVGEGATAAARVGELLASLA
jgi:thioredoxin reductase (NADPH)